MKLGTLDINKAYLVFTEIIKAYLGSNLIFDNTQPEPIHSLGIVVTTGDQDPYYYTSNTPSLSTANSWEIKTRVKYTKISSGAQTILSNNVGYYNGPIFLIHANGTLGVYASSNGTSFDLASDWTSQTTLSDGNIYDLSIGYDSSKGYYIMIQNTNGYAPIKELISSSTNNIYCTSSVFFLGNPPDASGFFRGSQFLNYTTITINGDTWFDGSTAVDNTDYINHGCIFNNNYVNNWYAYGSTTINDGIVSGFSQTNYIRYFGYVGDIYETNLFIKTPNSFNDAYILGNQNSSPILQFISHDGGSYANLYAVKASTTYYGVTQFQPNTNYIIKIISDGTNTKIYTILNTGYTKDTLPELNNWVLEITTSSSSWYNELLIGANGNGLDFAGTVDLNNSCVLIDSTEHTLPEGFTELTYVRSDGNQLVDLGFHATLNSKVKLKINPQYVDESGILGQDWALNGFFLMFYSSQIRWHSQGYIDVPVFTDTDYVIEAGNGTLNVNGTSYTCTPSTSLSSSHNIELFGLSNNGTIMGKFKLLFLEWYENDILTMKLIPVKNGFNSYVGLYDSIDHRVYYSTLSNLLDS